MNKIVKKILTAFTILFLSALCFQSCETELDINGDYQDVAVVYSILDPSSQYQYVRINRAFLGEGNALEFAQIPDSTLYPYLLDVKMQAINSNGQVVQTFTDVDTVHISKVSEIFFSGDQPVYRIKIPSVISFNQYTHDSIWLNSNYTYKIIITNPVTGVVTEGETPIIHSFNIGRPVPTAISVSFANNITTKIEWESAKNGRRYECKYIFTYYEIYESNPTDTITKTLNWNLGTVTSQLLSGGEDMSLAYNNYNFYSMLANNLEKRNDVQRYPGNVNLYITVGTDELNTYINVNTSSNSIIQERPQFTNVSSGIGLISSKFMKTMSYKLNVNSLDTLKFGEYTKDLNFNSYFY